MPTVVDLPAPFGPEQADGLAGHHPERHAVDGAAGAVRLDYSFNRNNTDTNTSQT
jgi:hypothetical protein